MGSQGKYIRTEEIREKMRDAALNREVPSFSGKHHSEETKKKLSDALKGNIPWNKGKSGIYSEEHRRKISESKKGVKIHTEDSIRRMKEKLIGRKHTEETKRKIAEANRNRVVSEETREKMRQANLGKISPIRGRPKTRISSIKTSCTLRGIPLEEFNGFITYQDYCEKFNDPFKERVRAFFGRRCVECGKSEESNGRLLDVHHVNYNKRVCCDDTAPLFVALCKSCHCKTQGKRVFWKYWYTTMINYKYSGKCYYTKEEYARLQHLTST